MTASDRVRSILAYGQTQAINFRCQGVVVNAALFTAVRQAIGSAGAPGSVSVTVDPRYAVPGAAPPAPGGFISLRSDPDPIAEYDPGRNMFRLPTENPITIFEEATVVHEAVHCGYDLDRRIDWPWFGQEANAYIAGARFALNKGVTLESMQHWGPVHAEAARIAVHLNRSGQEVTWAQYFPLRQAILNCPVYRGYELTFCYPNNG